MKDHEQNMSKCFEGKKELKKADFEELTVNVFAIPKILKDMLFSKIASEAGIKEVTADTKLTQKQVQ